LPIVLLIPAVKQFQLLRAEVLPTADLPAAFVLTAYSLTAEVLPTADLPAAPVLTAYSLTAEVLPTADLPAAFFSAEADVVGEMKRRWWLSLGLGLAVLAGLQKWDGATGTARAGPP